MEQSFLQSMKPPFHLRGPFMAKIWLLCALCIVGVQMLFMLNLLLHGKSSDLQGSLNADGEHESTTQHFSSRWDAQVRNNELINGQREEENSVDVNSQQHIQVEISPTFPPPQTDEPTTPPNDNSQIFNFLQNSVMQAFSRGVSLGNPNPAGQEPGVKMASLLPLLTLLPALTGQASDGSHAPVDWEKYMPLIERMEKFARHCTNIFQATVQEMTQKYPEKARKDTFVSAVAMKGFFRIFAQEDRQDEFLEVMDEAVEVLDLLGLTDHVIDLVSGKMYDKILSTGGGAGADLLSAGNVQGLAAMFLQTKTTSTTTTTMRTTRKLDAGNDEEEDEDTVEVDEDGKAAFVSNEHFEGIMEIYDLMYRNDETVNASAAKAELTGRMFLQTWYEATRRYTREKGRIFAKPFSEAGFEKYIESVEVPFSNILDFAYPIKNENFCNNISQFKLLIVVISKTKNLPLRNAIRQTWAQPSTDPRRNTESKVIFLLSDRDEDRDVVEMESSTHGDIVTVDVPETYEYASRKALVVMDWPIRNCPNAEYIFKSSDQIYVNISVVMKEAREAKKNENQLVGNVVNSDIVQRIPLKLDYLFYDEYPYDLFRPYIKGFGYLMSMEFAKAAINAAKDFPLIRTDDFSITGILAGKLKTELHAFFGSESAVSLKNAPWDDARKATELLCQKQHGAVFSGKLTAAQVLFIHSTLTGCSVN